MTEPIVKPMESSTKATLMGGSPLAIATVFVIEQLRDIPLDATTAVAFGSIGAAVFGELWLIFLRVTRKITQ